MKITFNSCKILVLFFVLFLSALLTFAQDRKLILDFHNKTEKEISNFVWGQSPMGLEVMEAVEDYHSLQNKFKFVILKDTILSYRSKIDGQLKKIGYFKKIVEKITESPAMSFEYFATYPEAKIQAVSIVNDSLEFEEAQNFGITPVVLNSNLIPQKELEKRQKDLDKQYKRAYKNLQKGKDKASWGLLEQAMYDLCYSLCNDGLFKSGRPTVYFVTPIGVIDQLIKQPVNIVGKIQTKLALKKLEKLKRLKADLQLAQRLYEKQYLVKE